MADSGAASGSLCNANSGGTQPAVSAESELFALCQTARSDGVLSQRERELIRTWTERSDLAQVPARAYVRQVVDDILRTGRVAPADLLALARALEPSLPPELKGRRRRERHLVAVRDGAPPAERLRNEILAHACFVVASCRADRLGAARAGDPLLLVRDAREPLSSNAIQVRTANGKVLGFVPELHAREFAPLLDGGARYRAHLVSVARGRQTPVLIAQAFFCGADALLGMEPTKRGKLARAASPGRSTLLRITVALLVAAAVALVVRT
jgi:hypothetical protein